MSVQIFGVKNDADTRKALRFFKERRVPVHFVDFKVKGPSKGELRRFFDRFGWERMIDLRSKRARALGLGSAHYGATRWLELAVEEPLILSLPLVRSGSRLAVGADEAAWRDWMA